MNYTILTSLFNSEYMPAEDLWLSGNRINYYYFGQYIISFITKISQSEIKEGFNLGWLPCMMTTFTFMAPCMIGYNLGNYLVKDNEKKKKNLVSSLLAILAGLAVSIGGTLYYPIYNFIVDRNGEPYYYWEDTRYIGYRPDTNDKTINEIVPYSNLVGDLHAHHIDTMLVFLTLALLLQLLLNNEEKSTKNSLSSPNIMLLSIILGMQKMTNYWDFPIYLVVISITIIFNNLMRYNFSKKNFFTTLAQILEIILLEEIVTLPFTLDLYLSANKILLTHVTSPFYKLVVLWGLPIVCVLLHIVELLINFIKGKEKNKFFKQVSEYISKIEKTDMFIFIIGCCAIGLIIIPEIIYVKDIYGEEFKRANTMYKLCYQAEIMFDISVSYILLKFLFGKYSLIKKSIATSLIIAFISTFGYGINGINYVTNNFNREKTDSLANTEYYIKKYYPHEYEAIQWIKNNVDKDDVILEKASGSYTINSHISVFSGNPTVLGWHGHEWIWRADKNYDAPKEVKERWDDINTLYTSINVSKIEEIIDKYDIKYIYISDTLDANYKTTNKTTLRLLGETVYEDKISEDNIIQIIKVR